MGNNLKVSVIIPAYDATATIGRAIDSVLHQTVPVAEIIVINDGSTDNTSEIVRSYGDAIRYFYQNNTGLSGAMNCGIEQAKEEWIAFLDADDEWLPGLVKSHIKLVSENPDVKWTYCRNEQVMQDGRRRMRIPQAVEEEIDREGFLSYFRAALVGFYFGKCGFMIQRSVFEELGNFDPAMRNGMDKDMWRRIALRHPRVAVCREVCWRYYLDNPNSLHRRGSGYRDLQLKSLCRNMRRAMELGPDVVKEFYPYARMNVIDLLFRAAGRQCWISSETIRDGERLFPLTVRERAMFAALRCVPTPIASRLAKRFRL